MASGHEPRIRKRSYLLRLLEAAIGIEPMDKGFAVRIAAF
jgi:uncharacterized protein